MLVEQSNVGRTKGRHITRDLYVHTLIKCRFSIIVIWQRMVHVWPWQTNTHLAPGIFYYSIKWKHENNNYFEVLQRCDRCVDHCHPDALMILHSVTGLWQGGPDLALHLDIGQSTKGEPYSMTLILTTNCHVGLGCSELQKDRLSSAQ